MQFHSDEIVEALGAIAGFAVCWLIWQLCCIARELCIMIDTQERNREGVED